MVKRKTVSIPLMLIGAIVFCYLGYLCGHICSRGSSFNEVQEKFTYVFSGHFFENYYNKETWVYILIAMLVYIYILVYWITSMRNYMFGKEFGTAKYENPYKVTLRLADVETLSYIRKKRRLFR